MLPLILEKQGIPASVCVNAWVYGCMTVCMPVCLYVFCVCKCDVFMHVYVYIYLFMI